MSRTPDAIAVLHGDQQIRFAELNARANQLTKFVQLLSQLFVPVATARAVAQ